MARSSNGTAGWRLESNSISPLAGSSGPFTVVLWFKAGSTAQSNTYVIDSTNPGVGEWAILYEYVGDAIEFYASGYSGDDPRIDASLTISNTNWHHIAYRKDASGSSNWDKFLDGSKTNIGAAKDFTFNGTMDEFYMFASASGDECNCALIDVAIYTVALSDAQIAALAKGYSTRCLMLIPAFAWDLGGRNFPEIDIYGAHDLTVTNVVYADNPKIIRPAG